VRIACSAPTRIDLAGGTFDIWPLYLFHEGAQTINAALGLRAHVTLTGRADRRVVLVSEDTGDRIEAASPRDLDVNRLPLVARLVRFFDAGGLEVVTRSDSPIGAGLAGSSAMNVAIAAALAAWTGRAMSDDALMTIAMNIEAQVIHAPTGVQDYRPALFGGVSALEMGPGGVRRIALAVDLDDLSRRLVLVYTGASRQSGINNWDVMQRRMAGDAQVAAAFDGIRDAAVGMRSALERHDWPAVASNLASEWEHRKRLAPGVTTPTIDALLESARAAGARAGKVCGAGGGGCLYCLIDPGDRAAVTDALSSAGATPLPCAIEREGLRLHTEH
jgi:D-glycero-alpha-D-manno-heptose-7-phosphate kinase